MSKDTVEKLKILLWAQLGKVESEIDKVATETHPEAPRETAELATFSWQMQIQETRQALVNHLILSRTKIQDALRRVTTGIYGICEHCGKKIEEARLKIMPTTTLCVGCK